MIQKTRINLKKIAIFLFILIATTYILIVGKSILSPLVFAVFFAFMMNPICDFYEKWLKSKVLSILITFIMIAFPIICAILIFGYQLVEALKDFPLITERLLEGVSEGFTWLNDKFELSSQSGEEWISENVSNIVDEPFLFIADGLSSSTQVITNIAFGCFYTFLLLLYKEGLHNFFLGQFSRIQRAKAEKYTHDVQELTQQYLLGIGIVIVILGLMNSAGLMLIGINYAFFWGFLAAFLAVIPYIGTFIGGSLPFMYALAVTETTWQPIAVIVLFVCVQTIEGNLITPNIVGSKVNINPLTAIFAVVIGGSIWGIGGLILGLPVVAIIKVSCDYIDRLKPLGLLMSSGLRNSKDMFLNEYDYNRYRLLDYFLEEKEVKKKKKILSTETENDE